MIPLIVDTDPGVDDCLAIMLAYAARLPIAAITTVFGNAGIDQTTKNALTIAELFKIHVPVFQGAEKPLSKDKRLPSSHGGNGLGGFALHSLQRTASKDSALEGIRLMCASQEKLHMIGLGPCTTIAEALRLIPDFLRNLDLLVLMGGVFGEPGNVTPYAEFNVYNDPDALHAVLASGVMPVLIPANICRKVTVSAQEISDIATGAIGSAIKSITDAYIQYYLTDAQYGGFDGAVMYDVLTVVYLLEPDLFISQEVYVEVDCSDGERRGATTIVPNGIPNCILITAVDALKAKEFFLTTVKRSMERIEAV